MSFEKTEADTATAKGIYDIMQAQIGTTKISYFSNIATAAKATHQSLAFTTEAVGTATGVPSTDSSLYSGAGKSIDGTATSIHGLSLWTATSSVGIQFSHEMTLSAAAVASKTFEQFTCAKISASNYL